MTLALQEILSALTKKQIDLIINDNRSTMVSILERQRKYARVSVHRMFLDAPTDVIYAIVDMVQNKRDKNSNFVLQKFINGQTDHYEYMHRLKKVTLETKGQVHDLEPLFQKVNRHYFTSPLNLSITWFGKPQKKNKRQISFGLYHHATKLVKINRVLDQINVPDFFVEYIIYHEMLHEIYRPQPTENGFIRIHTKEFKENEKRFEYYKEAKAFEEEFKKILFR